jgi:hypothetical protein
MSLVFDGIGTAFDMEEAVKRMSRRGKKSVSWTLKDRTVEKYIPATAARNWDGSSAGSGNDPNQEILQRMTWANDGKPRFSNWW